MVRRATFSARQIAAVDEFAQSKGFANRFGILRELGRMKATFGNVLAQLYTGRV